MAGASGSKNGSRGRTRTYNPSVNPDWSGLTIEQGLPYPASRFRAFDLALTLHGLRTGEMSLRPNQPPRTILSTIGSGNVVRPIVSRHARLQIMGLPDVKSTLRVLQDVYDVGHRKRAIRNWLQR